MAADLTQSISREVVASDSLLEAEGHAYVVIAVVCQRPLATGIRLSLADVDNVVFGRGVAREQVRHGRTIEIMIPDHEVSRRHVILRRCSGGWELSDLGSKNGTLVGGEPTCATTLSDGDVIEIGSTMIVYREDMRGISELRDRDLHDEALLPAFRTLHAGLQETFAALTKIAAAEVPVLVRGETGTGKELVASAIHELSGRSGPFVPINCGALPQSLIESELFGYRRGAFSGAKDDRDGLVRRADGGTLFLDEIAELPEESQVALLRVLQEGEVRPIGSSEVVHVDVRVVAATHQNLATRISEGRFRQDLYARLAGFEVTLPPLRDRREDIGTLITAILPKVLAQPHRVTLQRQAARALLRYAWPNNIRELQQALRTATVLAEGGEIRIEHLPEAIRTYVPPRVALLKPEDRALRERLLAVLGENDGNVAAAARVMGKAPIQLRRWCKRLDIDLSRFRR